MISKSSFKLFANVCFVINVFTLSLAVLEKAIAISIKDTNYPIPSGAYFVSPNGSASNSGTSADSPWPVAKAIESAPAGSTIIFRGGTYRDLGELRIRQRITLQPYPHEDVWLKGSVVVTDWSADGGIWRKDGWKHSFPDELDNSFIDPNYPMADHCDMVYVAGVALKQVGSKADVGPGKFYVDSRNDKLYIGDNPNGKTIEATAQKAVFSMWKSSEHDPSGTVIRGLGFTYFADQAVNVAAGNVILENNTFAWNGLQGVKFFGESAGIMGVSSDAVVRGNTFSHNGLMGVGGSYAHRLLLEDNVITYNNTEHFIKNWAAAGAKFLYTDGINIRRNKVEYNDATGLWIDRSSTNATIVGNTVLHNGAIGIFFELSHKAIIAANIAGHNLFSGIMISNSSSARVYNNSLAFNRVNITVKDTNRNNTDAQEIAAGITWIARNVEIKNNISSNAVGETFLQASNCTTGEPSSQVISALEGNAYYRPESTNPSNIVQWSLGGDECSRDYTSIAAFSTDTGREKTAIAVDDVAENPFFEDPSRSNFQLKLGSQARNFGQPLPSDIARAIGWTPGVSVDLGAIQSNQSNQFAISPAADRKTRR